MDTIGILSTIGGLLTGGGLTWLFTIKSTRQQAQADAMQHFQAVYQAMINDLRSEVTRLRDKLQRVEQEQQRIVRRLSKRGCYKALTCPDYIKYGLDDDEDE